MGMPSFPEWVILFATIVWIWTIIDVLRNDFKDGNKVVWLLVIIFLAIIGSLLYLLIGRKQKKPKDKNTYEVTYVKNNEKQSVYIKGYNKGEAGNAFAMQYPDIKRANGVVSIIEVT